MLRKLVWDLNPEQIYESKFFGRLREFGILTFSGLICVALGRIWRYPARDLPARLNLGLAAVFASYGALKTALFKRVNLPVLIKTNDLLGLNLTSVRR